MASNALALYTGSSSTYNLEGVPRSFDLVPESTFVREEAKAIIVTPLAIMPPPNSGTSGGASLKSTAWTKAPQGGAKPRQAPPSKTSMGTVGLKRKVPESTEPSKKVHVTPSGNTIFSRSYTVVGIKKPDGRYGNALMRKPTPKGKEPVETLTRKSVSKETADSSSQPFIVRRFREPPVIKGPPSIFESSDDELLPPKDPIVTSLNNKIINLRGRLGRLGTSLLKVVSRLGILKATSIPFASALAESLLGWRGQ